MMWAFSEGTDTQWDERKAAVEREQNPLKAMEAEDPAFARALTAKLIPDRERNDDIVRRVTP